MNPLTMIVLLVAIPCAALSVHSCNEAATYRVCVEHHAPKECDHNNWRLDRRMSAYEACVAHHSPEKCK